MVIHDGYAVISYDFKVFSSDANCLFNMKENLAEKEARLLEQKALSPDEIKLKIQKDLFKSLKNQAAKTASDYGLPLNLGNQIKDMDMTQMFEGVKPFLADQEKIQKELGSKVVDALKFAEDNKHHLETMKNVG